MDPDAAMNMAVQILVSLQGECDVEAAVSLLVELNLAMFARIADGVDELELFHEMFPGADVIPLTSSTHGITPETVYIDGKPSKVYPSSVHFTPEQWQSECEAIRRGQRKEGPGTIWARVTIECPPDDGGGTVEWVHLLRAADYRRPGLGGANT